MVTKGVKQEEKKQLRRDILARRRSLSATEIADKSQKIAEYFCTWPHYQVCETVMFYLAMPDEVQADLLITDALKQGKKVCVPLLGAKYGEMNAVEMMSLDDLSVGKFNLRAPDSNKAKMIAPSLIDLVVVPAVAFDRQGNRIGMGAGYYDRFLAQVRVNTVLLGLAFTCQLTENLPSEEHDIRMQWLLTEDGFLSCRT
ncbi:MAG: putative 5-formyltetrahydrofolate cyclo-ligase [Firmicutes bacterium]|nr:putative 5-formyltetrahydrofolate cyclo-ligase [Bacillota bacterium]